MAPGSAQLTRLEFWQTWLSLPFSHCVLNQLDVLCVPSLLDFLLLCSHCFNLGHCCFFSLQVTAAFFNSLQFGLCIVVISKTPINPSLLNSSQLCLTVFLMKPKLFGFAQDFPGPAALVFYQSSCTSCHPCLSSYTLSSLVRWPETLNVRRLRMCYSPPPPPPPACLT